MKTVNGVWYPGRGLAQRPSDALVEKSSKGTATDWVTRGHLNPDNVMLEGAWWLNVQSGQRKYISIRDKVRRHRYPGLRALPGDKVGH